MTRTGTWTEGYYEEKKQIYPGSMWKEMSPIVFLFYFDEFEDFIIYLWGFVCPSQPPYFMDFV